MSQLIMQDGGLRGIVATYLSYTDKGDLNVVMHGNCSV